MLIHIEKIAVIAAIACLSLETLAGPEEQLDSAVESRRLLLTLLDEAAKPSNVANVATIKAIYTAGKDDVTPAVDRAFIIALFQHRQYREAARASQALLLGDSTFDVELGNLFALSCRHGQQPELLVQFAESTFQTTGMNGPPTDTQIEQLKFAGKLVAVLKAENLPAAVQANVETLDRTFREDGSTFAVQYYIDGFDGIEEPLKNSEKQPTQRDKDLKQTRKNNLSKVEQEQDAVDQQRDQLTAQQKKTARKVQLQVDAIDRKLVPRLSDIQNGFMALDQVNLGVLHLQQELQAITAKQSTTLKRHELRLLELTRLDRLGKLDKAVKEKTSIESQLQPYMALAAQRQKLIRHYEKTVGAFAEQNGKLEALQKQLTAKEQNLDDRIREADLPRVGENAKYQLLFPFDVSAEITELRQEADGPGAEK